MKVKADDTAQCLTAIAAITAVTFVASGVVEAAHDNLTGRPNLDRPVDTGLLRPTP